MLVLQQRCDVWRWAVTGSLGASSSKRAKQLTRANIPCLVIPVSEVDAVVEFARESTHVAFLSRFMENLLRKEDELRQGRRVNPDGVVVQDIYTVVGVRKFPAFGLRHVEVYVKHLD